MKYQAIDNDNAIVLDGHPELPSGTRIHRRSRFWPAYEETVANEPAEIRPVNPGYNADPALDESQYWSYDDVAGTWSEDTVAKQAAANREEIEQLQRTDRATIRLLISLIDALLVNNTIQASEFTQAEINLYQRIKQLRGDIYGGA